MNAQKVQKNGRDKNKNGQKQERKYMCLSISLYILYNFFNLYLKYKNNKSSLHCSSCSSSSHIIIADSFEGITSFTLFPFGNLISSIFTKKPCLSFARTV